MTRVMGKSQVYQKIASQQRKVKISAWEPGAKTPAKAPDCPPRARQLHVPHSVKASSLGPAGTREVLLVGAGQAVQQPELRFSI